MHKRTLIKLLGLTVLVAIGVMAMSASAAQAKFLLLLNGKSVKSAGGPVEALEGLLEAENGLKIKCTGGTGNVSVELKNEDKEAVGTGTGTFTGCVWEGSEKTCTINDGGAGKIQVKGTGEIKGTATLHYVLVTGAPFTTIITEGALCTIPEEEEVLGSAKCHLLEELVDAKIHLCHLEPGNLHLGNSTVKKLTGEVHIKDVDPNATFALHLVNL